MLQSDVRPAGQWPVTNRNRNRTPLRRGPSPAAQHPAPSILRTRPHASSACVLTHPRGRCALAPRILRRARIFPRACILARPSSWWAKDAGPTHGACCEAVRQAARGGGARRRRAEAALGRRRAEAAILRGAGDTRATRATTIWNDRPTMRRTRMRGGGPPGRWTRRRRPRRRRSRWG